MSVVKVIIIKRMNDVVNLKECLTVRDRNIFKSYKQKNIKVSQKLLNDLVFNFKFSFSPTQLL